MFRNWLGSDWVSFAWLGIAWCELQMPNAADQSRCPQIADVAVPLASYCYLFGLHSNATDHNLWWNLDIETFPPCQTTFEFGCPPCAEYVENILSICYERATKSLWTSNDHAITARVSAIETLSTCNQYAIVLWCAAICNQYALNMLSICDLYFI